MGKSVGCNVGETDKNPDQYPDPPTIGTRALSETLVVSAQVQHLTAVTCCRKQSQWDICPSLAKIISTNISNIHCQNLANESLNLDCN